MPKIDICSVCKKGPKKLRYIHPETKEYICTSCYFNLPERKGICPKCGEGPKPLPSRDPETKKNICFKCCHRQKALKKRMFVPTRKGLAVKPPPKELREIDPGNELLEKLIIECEAKFTLILDSLIRNYGIKMSMYKLSKSISRNRKLKKLVRETREARFKREEEIQSLPKAVGEERIRLFLDELEQIIIKAQGKLTSEIVDEIAEEVEDKKIETTRAQIEARIERSIPAKFGLAEGEFEKAKKIYEEEGLVTV